MLLRARALLPAADAALVDDAWVQLRDARVVACGGGDAPDDPEVLDLGESLLMPGLCMAHTHVEFGLFRSHGDALPFFDWIRSLTRRRADVFDEAALLASARLSCLELVAAGVTGVGEATTHGEAAVRALRESGLRAVCYLEDFGPAPEDAPAVLERVRTRLGALEELAGGSRVRVGVSPHAPYTLSEPLFEGLLALAREEGRGVSMHLAETEAEVAFVRDGAGPFAESHRKRGIPVEARGRGPYAWVRDQGWLEGPREVLLVHGVELTEEDLEDLAGREGVHLVHCPRSNARLGEGVAPVRAALDGGVSVLLGTDGACSADRLDPFEEMRAALVLARASARDPAALRAEEALAAALRGNAALGFGPGRIEAGAPADLCGLSLEGPRAVPAPRDAAGAVLQLGAADVRFTMVDGEVLYRDGVFPRVDAAGVLREAREALARVGG